MNKPTPAPGPEKTTTIRVYVDGDTFVARCPHIPAGEDLGQATHDADGGRALNALMGQIRTYRARFESAGEAVPWIEDIEADAPDTSGATAVQAFAISGLWPPSTVAPKAPKTPKPKKPAGDPPAIDAGQ